MVVSWAVCLAGLLVVSWVDGKVALLVDGKVAS